MQTAFGKQQKIDYYYYHYCESLKRSLVSLKLNVVAKKKINRRIYNGTKFVCFIPFIYVKDVFAKYLSNYPNEEMATFIAL